LSRIIERSRRLLLFGLLLSAGACSSVPPSGTNQPLFLLSRISVQNLAVVPTTGVPGAPVDIRFSLVRSGDDGSPIYWTAYFMESPARGGALSRTSGGPLASGAVVDLIYTPADSTTAFVTIYPSSSPGQKNGDGSGDWQSFTIPVR
jgi:hypothetical protein